MAGRQRYLLGDGVEVDVAYVSFKTLEALKVQPYDVLLIQSSSNDSHCSISRLTTTVVQVVPTNHLDDSLIQPPGRTDKESECCGVLTLHPLLYEFLVRAQMSLNSDVSTHEQQPDCGEKNAIAITTSTASISSDYPYISYGWRAQVLDKDNVVDHDQSTKNIKLELTLICQEHGDSSETTTKLNSKSIARALDGRIVVDKSVIVVSAPCGGDALYLLALEKRNEAKESAATTSCAAFRLGVNYQFTVTIETDVDPPSKDTQEKNDIVAPRDICSGYQDLLQELEMLFGFKGKAAPSGVLLTGCAGVGKTKLASCLAQSLSNNKTLAHRVSIPDVLLQASWAMESDLIQLLLPPKGKGRVVLILDDLDVLATHDNDTTTSGGVNQGHDPELVLTKNAILTAMDHMSTMQHASSCSVLGICQYERSLPKELTRLGRLEKVVTMQPPTQWQRECILTDLLSRNVHQETVDQELAAIWVQALGPLTSGCVAADLCRLCASAWTAAWARQAAKSNWTSMEIEVTSVDADNNAINRPPICWDDLKEATQSLIPSQLAQLDVIKTPSLPKNVSSNDYRKIHEWSWRTFGGYLETRKRLYRTVVAPWRHFISSMGRQKQASSSVEPLSGIPPPSGVLFHGPSGTGKTLAASCLAASLGLAVVRVRASQVMDQWLGGSEAAVRTLFARARGAAPCILFFDEIDAIATNREDSDTGGGDVSSRLLSTFLNEMDGISSTFAGLKNGGVLVVAATNRLDCLDAALLRPGRLEEHVELPLPTEIDIQSILEIHLAQIPLENSRFDEIKRIADSLTELHASGADVEGFCRTLCLDATRNSRTDSPCPCVPRVVIDDSLESWRNAQLGYF